MNPGELDELLGAMFAQAHAQFGAAVKGYWLYEGECPGCTRPVSALRVRGRDAIALNAYIYRKRGVLIGYLLCGRCAKEIHSSAKRRPGVQIGRHDRIEKTMDAAFEAYMNL